ncbi:MAG: cytochrome c oxidase accessory protein CcoG [Gammaproteobacteria bacterium]|nr:cytochrome c oxidase accessory protein CcoG [Gammaproteobacteria bacterium]
MNRLEPGHPLAPPVADPARIEASVPLDDLQRALYEKRQKVYPREVHGLFAGLRYTGVVVLLGLFYGLPWIDLGGTQIVLWDLPNRKFHLFGLVFWPQDFIYLTLLLIIAAMSLFFFTTLAGRLWCGYACPQTVWTEVFLWIERFVEGSRIHQIRLDQAPLSLRKVRIKATKHALWIAFALYTGFTFVGYFTPIRELAAGMTTLALGPWESFWILFYGFATYGNAGWLREQVCKYMCPYARFQSAMFDADTLIVSYDVRRGEPRGARRPGTDQQAAGLGDCINCGLCVQVCPTGIDIRNGLQHECISCSACIDACDTVMEKVGYPKGLIRYTTEHALAGEPVRVLRPRVFVYGAILLVLTAAAAWGIASRTPFALDVIRDRNQLYRETDDGRIENVYTLKILNKEQHPRRYTLNATGIDGLSLAYDAPAIEVDAGAVFDLPVRLSAGEDQLSARSTAVQFELRTTGSPAVEVRADARFIGPAP